jgi:hypothetical protein
VAFAATAAIIADTGGSVRERLLHIAAEVLEL